MLVVDDEPDARELLTTVLEQAGATVRAVASAEEAVTAVQSDDPDVLISDIGMPDEDGYSLIRRVRALDHERGRGVPAIALTAYARREDRQRVFAAGFQIHLSKPAPADELRHAVSLLAQRHGRQ